MLNVTTITQKGQVTIPVTLRDKLGLTSGKKVKFVPNPDNSKELILYPIKDFISLKGSFKTRKKYSKEQARRAFIKDVIAKKS